MSESKVWAEGLFFDRHERAPDFVIGRMGIDVKRFVNWLEKQPVSEKGYLNIQITRSRDGTKYSAALDTWKPNQRDTPVADRGRETAAIDLDDDGSIPF